MEPNQIPMLNTCYELHFSHKLAFGLIRNKGELLYRNGCSIVKSALKGNISFWSFTLPIFCLKGWQNLILWGLTPYRHDRILLSQGYFLDGSFQLLSWVLQLRIHETLLPNHLLLFYLRFNNQNEERFYGTPYNKVNWIDLILFCLRLASVSVCDVFGKRRLEQWWETIPAQVQLLEEGYMYCLWSIYGFFL